MKILHITESHTVHTARLARSQVLDNHEVSVATFHDFVGNGAVHLIRVNDWARRMPYHHHWVGLASVAGLTRRLRPDIVHGHYLSTAVLYLGAARAEGTVASAVGSDVLVDPRSFHTRALFRALPHWTDRFTSVAPHVTRRMVELGIPSDRISTFPWGVDLELFHPPARAPEAPLVISTRSFERVYDLPTLAAAFARLSKERDGTRMAVYGDGSQRPLVETGMDRFRREGVVRFEGRVGHERLAEALRQGTVYVSTATSDGASTSLLEAMATGLVPIVTNIEANRLWVEDGRNGLLFPPGDAGALARAIDRALGDHSLRERCFRENPRVVAERASWDTSLEKLDGVYRQVLA